MFAFSLTFEAQRPLLALPALVGARPCLLLLILCASTQLRLLLAACSLRKEPWRGAHGVIAPQ